MSGPTTKDAEAFRSKPGVYEAFEALYIPEPNSGCWLWVGSFDKENQYGSFSYMSEIAKAHRVSYMLHKGQIDPKLVVRHLCNNRACVNPDHVVNDTQSENRRDVNRVLYGAPLKPHCAHGHLLTPENTYIGTRNGRNCRICLRTRAREKHKRKREAAVAAAILAAQADNERTLN